MNRGDFAFITAAQIRHAVRPLDHVEFEFLLDTVANYDK